MFGFLLVLIIGQAVGFQSWRTLFNNFAVDEIGLNGFQVGVVQSLREVPGFLAFTVIFILLLVRESVFAGLMIIGLGLGVALTGMLNSFHGLIISTLIMSISFHYFETTNQSLTLQSFSHTEAPLVMSWFKSVAAITNIAVGLSILAVSTFLDLPMKYMYLVFGLGIAVMVMLMFITRKVPNPGVPQKLKIVLKRKYWLFYVLNFLSGARRQIFVVFAVFMLVDKYEYNLETIAALFVLNNIITWRLSPWVGKWINKYGERKMLSIEYGALVIIFISYALIENRYAGAALYVINHLFYSFAIAINTFFQKNAEPQDIAPSMATGFTINHIMAVIIPTIGGLLWMVNWRIPFMIGACFAAVSFYFAQKVKIPVKPIV